MVSKEPEMWKTVTNLGAVKIILGVKQFVLYLIFVILFSQITGLVTNIVTVF